MKEARAVNVRTDGYDVLVDRRTKWGNPFILGKDGDRFEVIRKYMSWLCDRDSPGFCLLVDLDELVGKTLGCHCKPLPCHADVLVLLANMKAKCDAIRGGTASSP